MKLTNFFKNKVALEPPTVGKFGEELDFSVKEAFNTARTNITFVLPDKTSGKIIGVTSACPHDGKSSVSINLSYTLAKSGSSVLLIDADMRCPAISKYLKLRSTKGLSDILATDMEPVYHENVLVDGMDVLGSGWIPPNPSELLTSNAMGEFLSQMEEKYDYIILDLPPVLAVTDAVAVSKYLDGAIMVVRHALTRKRDFVKAIRDLEISEIKILGFVYNAYKSGWGSNKEYRYRYGNYRSEN